MRYVLAIGLETEIYKNPRLEVFLNDRFLGMTELNESVPAEIQQYKKSDLLDPWNHRPYSNPERKYKMTLPKKWIIYELDDSAFKKNNKLDIIPKNLQTNNMNGFVTKMDKCKIFNVMLLPKDWFSSEGIQKIFGHCDGRNVVIDFAHGHGWPEITITRNNNGTDDDHEHHAVYNASTSHSIVYDEILELYMIEMEENKAKGMTAIHTTLKNYNYNLQNPNRPYKIYACHPQQPFENNDNTTVLLINNDVKLQLGQIATKYQHNED